MKTEYIRVGKEGASDPKTISNEFEAMIMEKLHDYSNLLDVGTREERIEESKLVLSYSDDLVKPSKLCLAGSIKKHQLPIITEGDHESIPRALPNLKRDCLEQCTFDNSRTVCSAVIEDDLSKDGKKVTVLFFGNP